MNLHWRDFTRKDVIGFLVAVAIVVAVGAWSYLSAGAYVKANMGLGPDWVCSNPYGNGPVCIKKPSAIP